MPDVSGGCQCGAVRFRTTALLGNAHVCHCRMCQKAAGSFFGARVGVWLRDLTWTRGEPARFYSSEGKARGFCRACGTSLYFHNEEAERRSMSIGAFDKPVEIPLAFELGIEGKLPQVAQLQSLESFGTTEEEDPEGAAYVRTTSQQHPDHDTVHLDECGTDPTHVVDRLFIGPEPGTSRTAANRTGYGSADN